MNFGKAEPGLFRDSFVIPENGFVHTGVIAGGRPPSSRVPVAFASKGYAAGLEMSCPSGACIKLTSQRVKVARRG